MPATAPRSPFAVGDLVEVLRPDFSVGSPVHAPETWQAATVVAVVACDGPTFDVIARTASGAFHPVRMTARYRFRTMRPAVA